MTRKVFFAAFVIDEEAYTPEPGPVDCHFVAADLAQSSFGEQPGVSNIAIWDSPEDLIADHRRQGPTTVGYLLGDKADHNAGFAHRPSACPSNHWNCGDDICADCGTDLNIPQKDAETPPPALRLPFRDHLSPAMRDTLAFD